PTPDNNPPTSTLFFYMPPPHPYGLFCQWAPFPLAIPTRSLSFLLSAHAGTLYFHTAEHLYMYAKAAYFADVPSSTAIQSSATPKAAKALGRRVSGFSDAAWASVRFRVASVGNWYKFVQHRDMRDVLLGTGECELAEAAARDRVWGVGFNAGMAEGMRRLWGLNLLGKALMRVRGRLRVVGEEDEGAGGDREGDQEEGEDGVGEAEAEAE
ncbi:hypothetical protein BDV95DRAFT_465999, partial [Massariosphaeria phaeospora]